MLFLLFIEFYCNEYYYADNEVEKALDDHFATELIKSFSIKEGKTEEEILLIVSGDNGRIISSSKIPRKRLKRNIETVEDKIYEEFYSTKDKLRNKSITRLVTALKEVANVLGNSILFDNMKKLNHAHLSQIVADVNARELVSLVKTMDLSVHDFCDVCMLVEVRMRNKQRN